MRGKVSVLSQFRTNHRDHPRVCGEKASKLAFMCNNSGSLPHMRGKDFFIEDGLLADGITPAYTGKRECQSSLPACPRDHPRICGEKTAHVSGGQRTSGITPAYAGKRCHSIAGFAVCGDHPRICGEKTCPHRCRTAVWGSPPHMRGKVLEEIINFNQSRITPAYAGKSILSDALRAGS